MTTEADHKTSFNIRPSQFEAAFDLSNKHESIKQALTRRQKPLNLGAVYHALGICHKRSHAFKTLEHV